MAWSVTKTCEFVTAMPPYVTQNECPKNETPQCLVRIGARDFALLKGWEMRERYQLVRWPESAGATRWASFR